MANLSKKTKIIYLITKSNWGGAQKYVFDMASSLPKDEYEVLVITGPKNAQGAESGAGLLLKRLEENKIPAKIIPELKRNISFLKEIIIFFKLLFIFLKERPDVIHLNSSKISGLGALAGRLSLVKNIIFTVHGWPFNEARSNIQKKLIRFFSWLTVLFSHKAVVVSKNDFEQALSMKAISHKFTYIPNGIKTPVFIEKDMAREMLIKQIKERGDHTPDKNSLWIGTISELHKNKGLEYLIHGAGRLIKDRPDLNINLVLIGGGEEKSKLEKLIADNELTNKVFLAGFIPEATNLLKALDIFTLTSIKEGHPYTLLEAGFAGLPALISKIPGITDVANENNSVLTEVKNVTEISHGLETLAVDRYKRKNLGEALREEVLSKFSFENTFEKTTSLYRRD